MLTESQIEARLRKKVISIGGKALKFISPGLRGVPDRLVFLPGGKIFFVELKKPGEKPKPLQKKRIKEFEDMGFRCYVIDSYEKVEGFIDDIQST